METKTEIEELANRLIEREILMRANTVFNTLYEAGKISFEDCENIFRPDATEEERDNGEDVQEPLEYYFVSDWLAAKLKAIGEPVFENDCLDFPIWGRTCSGQHISLDGTFQQIAKLLNHVEAA